MAFPTDWERLVEHTLKYLNRSDADTVAAIPTALRNIEPKLWADLRVQTVVHTATEFVDNRSRSCFFINSLFDNSLTLAVAENNVSLVNPTEIFSVRVAESKLRPDGSWENLDPDDNYDICYDQDGDWYPSLIQMDDRDFLDWQNIGTLSGRTRQITSRRSWKDGSEVPTFFKWDAGENRVRITPWGEYPDDTDEWDKGDRKAWKVEVKYYGGSWNLEIISGTKTVNELYEKYPEMYLYAVLTEMCLYLRDPEQAAIWRAQYDERVSIYREQDKRQQYSGSLPVTGSPYAVE